MYNSMCNEWRQSWTVSAWGHSRGEIRRPRPVSRYESSLTTSLISWACVSHSQLCMCANASVSLFSPSPVSIQGWRTKAGQRTPGCLWQRFKSQRPEPWPSRCVRAWIISEGAHHSKKHKQSINSRGQWLFVMRNDDAAAAMTKCSSDLMSPWHWLHLLSQLSMT